ncbi:alpha/beta fold hydrolase, partial [Paracoccus sp. (in: a-proteobacteria)]|uniref:alpha/beta fold hydrolase n=1 Tax=Paracoccus sp. TaxID=267 RepID=UPI003A8509D8
ALEATDLTGLTRRSDADRRLAEMVHAPGLRAFLLQSLDLKSDPPRWRLNLPVLRDWMERTTGWPDGLPQATFGGPVLFMAGADSDYVDQAGEAAMRSYFPQARLVRLKNAGHWMHADAPEAVASTLAAFLGAG